MERQGCESRSRYSSSPMLPPPGSAGRSADGAAPRGQEGAEPCRPCPPTGGDAAGGPEAPGPGGPPCGAGQRQEVVLPSRDVTGCAEAGKGNAAGTARRAALGKEPCGAVTATEIRRGPAVTPLPFQPGFWPRSWLLGQHGHHAHRRPSFPLLSYIGLMSALRSPAAFRSSVARGQCW